MDDLRTLQGTWIQTRFEENGMIEPPDIHGGTGTLTTIDGDRFAVRTPDGDLLLAGRFILDPSTTPKSITWIDNMGDDAGKPLSACYELTDDAFIFVAADEGMPLPTRFTTAPGLTLRGFVRLRAP